MKVLQKAPLSGVPDLGFQPLAVYLLAALAWSSVFGGSTALAQTEFSTAASQSLSSPQVRSQVLTSEKSKHRTYGYIRLEGMKYFTEIPENRHLTYSQFLSGQLSYLGETGWFENAADVSAGTFFSRSQSHFVVHELYTSPRTQGYRASIGRKKHDWSQVDHDWNLGIWQPYYELDSLRPEEQGLTGVFLDVNRDTWQVLGFASPLFIPSMGPEVREENGGLVSDSRWYHAPSRQVDFSQGKPMAITYKLSVPEAAKLASHGGFGLSGRVGNREKGLWVSSSYGYQPNNQLLLKRNIKADLTNEIGVIVSPEVTYHHVVALDVGYTEGPVRASVSYLQDDPEEVRPEVDWAIQKLYGIRTYAAGVEWTTPKILSRSILLQVNYLHVQGGKVQDIVHDGSPDMLNLFDQRLKFTDAVKVKVQGELVRIYRRPLVTKFSYLFDKVQKGSMINTEFLFYPDQKWAFVVGADFLGADETVAAASSFLNQYRANDRVYGGMSYVF